MELTFLGTGAATACPLPFCRCETCRAAREGGGRDVRSRASLLIDGDLLIDLGPDAVASAARLGRDLTNVRWWLQTHAHSDHFDAGHLVTRLAEYAAREVRPVTLIASRPCMARMSERMALEEAGATLMDVAWRDRLRLRAIEVSHADTVVAGPYRVTAIESLHDPSVGSLIYAVERGGAAFLYAVDSVELTEDAWALLRARDMRFHAVAIDHTYGSGVGGGGHLGAEGVARTIERLKAERLLAPGAVVYATHISHEGNPPHAELERYAARRGYRAAWDGLSVRVSAGHRCADDADSGDPHRAVGRA
jgi:phosphoribosyl 1,2-cyclic phosphate phosphodiesterase